MPFVQRTLTGTVSGIFAKEQLGYAQEFLASDHPDVVAYFNHPPTVAQLRAQALDVAIDADTVIQQLKAMTNDEFNTWWDANVTTPAQAIVVLKRLVRVMIRRVL